MEPKKLLPRDQFGGQFECPRQRTQQERNHNVFSGFDERILAEAFNIDTRLARRMKNNNDDRSINRNFQAVIPPQSREEEERKVECRGSQRGRFCTTRLKHNIKDPKRANVFKQVGRLTTVNSLILPVLGYVQFSVERGVQNLSLYIYNL
ncbi:unnamed protein product [Dovyalis caffra]|uniref:Uncharacterized protein n=1 Tax=Dovyalis caffra TaxID=77055 RepID=A0AAV1RMK3_9ROSI|nr:unnamed protein product [Dovyalis caffra]